MNLYSFMDYVGLFIISLVFGSPLLFFVIFILMMVSIVIFPFTRAGEINIIKVKASTLVDSRPKLQVEKDEKKYRWIANIFQLVFLVGIALFLLEVIFK